MRVCALLGNTIENTTPNQKAIHKDRGDRNHLYHGISIKPQCHACHWHPFTDAKTKESHFLIQLSREDTFNICVQDVQLVLK